MIQKLRQQAFAQAHVLRPLLGDRTLGGYIVQGDTLKDFKVRLYADSDLAGDRPSFKSTRGYFASVSGANTFLPSASKSRMLGTVSHSLPEESAAANLALRSVGFPALNVLDSVCGHGAPCTKT